MHEELSQGNFHRLLKKIISQSHLAEAISRENTLSAREKDMDGESIEIQAEYLATKDYLH